MPKRAGIHRRPDPHSGKMLRNAKIIDDESIATDVVSIGSTVLLKDLEYGDQFEYTIVGSVEADLSQ